MLVGVLEVGEGLLDVADPRTLLEGVEILGIVDGVVGFEGVVRDPDERRALVAEALVEDPHRAEQALWVAGLLLVLGNRVLRRGVQTGPVLGAVPLAGAAGGVGGELARGGRDDLGVVEGHAVAEGDHLTVERVAGIVAVAPRAAAGRRQQGHGEAECQSSRPDPHWSHELSSSSDSPGIVTVSSPSGLASPAHSPRSSVSRID